MTQINAETGQINLGNGDGALSISIRVLKDSNYSTDLKLIRVEGLGGSPRVLAM